MNKVNYTFESLLRKNLLSFNIFIQKLSFLGFLVKFVKTKTVYVSQT